MKNLKPENNKTANTLPLLLPPEGGFKRVKSGTIRLNLPEIHG
jgi:hypothetical protein